MRAIVNDPIHIEVQCIEFRYPIFCDQLRDGRVPLTHPSKELGDTHDKVQRTECGDCLCMVFGCTRDRINRFDAGGGAGCFYRNNASYLLSRE
jgi:hypothetical protein